VEAAQRAEQGPELVERVVAELGRLDRELEGDLVDAVGDPQPDARDRRCAPDPAPAARRVLDEDADVRAAVELRPVEHGALVDPSAPLSASGRGGTPLGVLHEVGHRRPSFRLLRAAVVLAQIGDSG
jgi:hypothetical protein